jgi:hypothetical protein
MISGILALFFNVITVNKSAEYYSKAYKILDSKAETLRGTAFDSVVNSSTSISEIPSGNIAVTVTNTVDGAPRTNIKKVDIVISWNFRKQSSIREVTYITRGGIKK